MNHQPHSPYYRDRDSEYDLCNDFPGDEILIDGLHAMQLHFWNNNVNVEIPVVRVMNTAHYIAAYMFATTCSGDQMEYDVMAYDSLSRDKQLTRLTMIVLAAMLRRTEGFRARSCRNLILDNRDPDFDEGVTLYDRFLRSAEERFTEVMVSPLSGVEKCLDLALRTEETMRNVVSTIDHLDGRGIDILLRQQQEISRLTSENIQLKYTLTKMENQQNIQYKQDNNQGTIYNAPVYITYAAPQQVATEPISADEPKSEQEKPAQGLFCRITKAAYEKGVAQQVDDDLRSACISAPKLVKALKTNDALGYTDTKNLNSSDLYDMLDEHYGLAFKKHHFTVCRSK